MPMGPAPLGFTYFVGVKFVGYIAAAFVLRNAYPGFNGSVTKVGAARTAIGVGVGLAYGAIWIFFLSKVMRGESSEYLYFLGLFPVRMIEWLWLLHLFFDRRLQNRPKAIKAALGGTVWSYCLDAAGIAAAMVIPGGIWVC
jgi:hypothetical protein